MPEYKFEFGTSVSMPSAKDISSEDVDYDSIIEEAAEAHGVEADLIRSVIGIESGGKPKALSSKGASGLMQLMPKTAKAMGVEDITNPRENIMGGTKYLAKQLSETGGDVPLALARYNAGPGAVKKHGGIPPYPETQNYVKKVTGAYDKLKGTKKAAPATPVTNESGEYQFEFGATKEDEFKGEYDFSFGDYKPVVVPPKAEEPRKGILDTVGGFLENETIENKMADVIDPLVGKGKVKLAEWEKFKGRTGTQIQRGVENIFNPAEEKFFPVPPDTTDEVPDTKAGMTIAKSGSEMAMGEKPPEEKLSDSDRIKVALDALGQTMQGIQVAKDVEPEMKARKIQENVKIALDALGQTRQGAKFAKDVEPEMKARAQAEDEPQFMAEPVGEDFLKTLGTVFDPMFIPGRFAANLPGAETEVTAADQGLEGKGGSIKELGGELLGTAAEYFHNLPGPKKVKYAKGEMKSGELGRLIGRAMTEIGVEMAGASAIIKVLGVGANTLMDSRLWRFFEPGKRQLVVQAAEDMVRALEAKGVGEGDIIKAIKEAHGGKAARDYAQAQTRINKGEMTAEEFLKDNANRVKEATLKKAKEKKPDVKKPIEKPKPPVKAEPKQETIGPKPPEEPKTAIGKEIKGELKKEKKPSPLSQLKAKEEDLKLEKPSKKTSKEIPSKPTELMSKAEQETVGKSLAKKYNVTYKGYWEDLKKHMFNMEVTGGQETFYADSLKEGAVKTAVEKTKAKWGISDRRLTTEAPKVERRSGERRDTVLRKAVDKMSPEEQAFVIPELRRMNKNRVKEISKLKKEIITDPLTGLRNREGITKVIDRAEETGKSSQYTFIDLVGFKGLNDGIGYLAGDQTLEHIGKGMKALNLKATRTGGDEFGFVSNTPEEAEANVKKLQEYFNKNQVRVKDKAGKEYDVNVLFRHGTSEIDYSAKDIPSKTKAAQDLAESKKSTEPKEWKRGETHPGLTPVTKPKRRMDKLEYKDYNGETDLTAKSYVVHKGLKIAKQHKDLYNIIDKNNKTVGQYAGLQGAIDAIDKGNYTGIVPGKAAKVSKAGENIRTLRGYVKYIGKINPLNFKGEVRDLPKSTQFLFKKDGVPIDDAVRQLIDDGWIHWNSTVATFLEELRTDEAIVSRDRLVRDVSEKKEFEKTAAEKKFEAELEDPDEGPMWFYTKDELIKNTKVDYDRFETKEEWEKELFKDHKEEVQDAIKANKIRYHSDYPEIKPSPAKELRFTADHTYAIGEDPEKVEVVMDLSKDGKNVKLKDGIGQEVLEDLNLETDKWHDVNDVLSRINFEEIKYDFSNEITPKEKPTEIEPEFDFFEEENIPEKPGVISLPGPPTAGNIVKLYRERYGPNKPIVLTNKDGTRGIIIHKAVKKPERGGFQTSYWDKRGFSGDTWTKTEVEAVSENRSSFKVLSPESFDKISKTRMFQKYPEAFELHKKRWEGGESDGSVIELGDGKAPTQAEKDAVSREEGLETIAQIRKKAEKTEGIFEKKTLEKKADHLESILPKAKESWEIKGSQYIKSAPLPPMDKIPQKGQFPAVMTDDGSIYVDTKPEGSTHILFIEKKGIPGERLKSGGWIKDGVYEDTVRSDTSRYAEQMQAKKRTEHKSLVRKALKKGKSVPSKVLNEYPELKAEHEKALIAEGVIEEKRKFFGIRDKVDRGLMTKEDARAGKKPEATVSKNRLTANAADLAADYKAKGIERQATYSQFVKDRALKPEMDAKDFYEIYDSVSPKLFKPGTKAKAKKPEIIKIEVIDPNGMYVDWSQIKTTKTEGLTGEYFGVYNKDKSFKGWKNKTEIERIKKAKGKPTLNLKQDILGKQRPDGMKKGAKAKQQGLGLNVEDKTQPGLFGGTGTKLYSGIPVHEIAELSKALGKLYDKHVGEPLWIWLSDTLPEAAGDRFRLIDAINKGIITDYKKDPRYLALREDTQLKIELARKAAKNLAEIIKKFPRAEQVRVSQIIRGSVTQLPERYKAAFEAMEKFKMLEKELQKLGILGPDNIFKQFTRKELGNKFKEVKALDDKILQYKKRLQPIIRRGKVIRKSSEMTFNEIKNVIVETKTGKYKTDSSKWTDLNEGRIKEALMSRGFADGEAKQMIERVKESVLEIGPKEGTLKEITTTLEKIVTKTITTEVERIKTFSRSYMARAKASILKDIKDANTERNIIINRIQTHYRMSGKHYLRRAYKAIETEDNFLAKIMGYATKRPRLKKGYNIQRKNLSKLYRQQLGEIQEAPFLVYKGLSEEYHDMYLMEMFNEISENKKWAVSAKEWDNIMNIKARASQREHYKDFKPLPLSDKLGKLSGAMIDPYIWDDLNEAVKHSSEIMKAYDKLLNLWKIFKVPFNPATQFRNTLSNTILADFAGLSPFRIDIYAGAAKAILTKSGVWKEIDENTMLFGKEWIGGEVKEFLEEVSNMKDGNFLFKSAQIMKTLANKPLEVYQGIEQFFKTALYMYSREQGASIKEAAAFAEEWIFNYQKVPPAIRWAKRWYSPFITFSYKAMPRMAETAIRKPWKIAKYAIAMLAVEEVTRRMYGESKEEIKREKKVLPDYMRKNVLPGQLSHLRIPWPRKFGRSKYLDLSFILPWGDVAEQWGQSRLVGRPFLPTHPLLTVAEVAFNEVLFTGQELTLKDIDTGSEYLKKIGTQIWRQAAPSLAGSYSYNKLMSALRGERDWALRERSVGEAVFDVFFGLKIRSIDYNEERGRRLKYYKGKIDEIRDLTAKDYEKIFIRNPTPDLEEDQRRYLKLAEKTNRQIQKIMDKITEIEE